MNREETRKAAEVMLHYANGGEVQRTTRKQPEHWLDMTDYNYPNGPQWDWRSAQYRIKPQPVEVRAWAVLSDVCGCRGVDSLFCLRPNAESRLEYLAENGKAARIVEVTGTYMEDTP
jgi:hypothetical protein